MKKSFFFGLLLLVGTMTIQSAQASGAKDKGSETSIVSPLFEFDDYTSQEEWSSIPHAEAGSHLLGEIIAKKVCLVKKLYISQNEVAPGTPGVRMYIRKPGIYQSFNKLEKHYKKSVRKKTCSLQEAQKTFNHVLDVVIALYVHETKDFELALQKAKTAENQIEIYSKTKLNSF